MPRALPTAAAVCEAPASRMAPSMTPNQAQELLDRHAPPGEQWPLHCRQVARVAVALADAAQARGHAVDRPGLEVQALLHDIGRSRTHGPMHGWSGFVLLRSLGHAAHGRGCLTHWLKGRTARELAEQTDLSSAFVDQVYASLDPGHWTLQDSLMSIADSSVRHTTIVPLADRHDDLLHRYGDSPWIRRTIELGEQQADEVGDLLGVAVDEVLAPLHGHRLD